MARPTKQGIEYFPVDVQFDDKVELYIAECGAEGFGILVTIWQIIYQNEGYFVKNNDDLVLLVRRRIMSQASVISECIRCAVVRGVFDERLEKKYGILTSKGIQKRYLAAAKRKKEVYVNKNYIYGCIIENNNLPVNVVFDGENTIKEEVKEKEEVNTKSPKKMANTFNHKDMKPKSVSDEMWSAFIGNRKHKKLQNSELALKTIMNSFKEGLSAGYTYEQMITRYVSSGMQRFKVEWMKEEKGGDGWT